MLRKPYFLFLLASSFLPAALSAQHQHAEPTSLPVTQVAGVEPQPFLAQAIRLQEALSFLGSSLSAGDTKRLIALKNLPLTPETTKTIQEILDPYCLAMVSINPEARVKVLRGPAQSKLIQGGWTSFLVKVINEAGVTAKLEVESPNAEPILYISSSAPQVKKENVLTAGQVANRFLEMQMYRNRPLLSNLSGLKLEYAVLQIFSKDAGQREAEIGFNVGHGSQDIGFRNAVNILFTIQPSVKVTFNVKDDDGSPTVASFLITDGIERVIEDSVKDMSKLDYRTTRAQLEYWVPSKELRGAHEPDPVGPAERG